MDSVSTTQTTAVEARPLFAPSLSFSGSSSTASVSRPLKRHLTSDLDFLAPAAATFKPHPYTPANLTNSSLTGSRNRYLHSTRQQNRASATSPPLTLDVSEKDPDAVFIRPPFDSFPGADTFPEGLTYTLMADHPDWFLDPKDYLPLEGPAFKPGAIPYPPYLEPPRGWCPAKKRDLKDKGPDGWAEGEEPRLRCTFCRRHYAGVNAKSMWRRHVFEKHKVAMSNRREGCERPRGRGSTKENRQPGTLKEKTLDNVIGMEVAPQTSTRNTTHKSKFHSLPPVLRSQKDAPILSSADNATTSRPSRSPPSTPPPLPSSDALETTCLSPCPAPYPSSPYDPSLTPSFRHCSPSPPSEHPWRYPSPSHPLYSRQCEISLSDLRSPIAKKGIQNGASPKTGTPEASLRKFGPLVAQALDSGPSLPLSSPSSLKGLNSPLTGSARPWRPPFQSNSPLALSTHLTQHHNLTISAEDWFPRFEDSLISTIESPAETSIEFTGESPILRSRTLPQHAGIGLLGPFTFLSDPSHGEDDDEAEVEEALIAASQSPAENNSRDPSPPFKRRKLVDVFG